MSRKFHEVENIEQNMYQIFFLVESEEIIAFKTENGNAECGKPTHTNPVIITTFRDLVSIHLSCGVKV